MALPRRSRSSFSSAAKSGISSSSSVPAVAESCGSVDFSVDLAMGGRFLETFESGNIEVTVVRQMGFC